LKEHKHPAIVPPLAPESLRRPGRGALAGTTNPSRVYTPNLVKQKKGEKKWQQHTKKYYAAATARFGADVVPKKKREKNKRQPNMPTLPNLPYI